MEISYVKKILNKEIERQHNTIELIASENFPSQEVIDIVGTPFMSKYCEGYPSKEAVESFKERFPDYIHTGNTGRYYAGTKWYDELELYCRYMWKKVFNTDYHCNVQGHSGSSTNMEIYASVLNPGDTVLLVLTSPWRWMPAELPRKIRRVRPGFRRRWKRGRFHARFRPGLERWRQDHRNSGPD